ncbi:MAG: ATP-grasp domain-containing protein [Chitinophagaceae bacterium]|nr:ATP-grasp domain-containing protein [Chitinophagaceae bacterium]
MGKKLAIIGGSYLQLPIVKKAVEMDIETHCFSWEDGAVCKDIASFFYPISITEKDQILEECKRINIDGITSIASDVAVSTVNYITAALELPGNPDTITANVTNKYKMRQALVAGGLRTPGYKLVTHKDKITPEITDPLKYPLIVKPVDRSGSLGVYKIENETSVVNALEQALRFSFCKQVIIEEFIEGRELSIESISWDYEHFILAYTDKYTTGAPHFVELAHHQPAVLSQKLRERIKQITHNALKALGVKVGAAHTEIKVTERGDIYIIEVGARMGGDFIGSNLVRLSTGYDYLAGVIDVSLGRFVIPELSETGYAGIYFLSKETAEILPFIENHELYDEIVSAELINKNLIPVEKSSDRSGYFIYCGNKRFIPG